MSTFIDGRFLVSDCGRFWGVFVEPAGECYLPREGCVSDLGFYRGSG